MGRINKKPELVIQRSIETALDHYKRAGIVIEYIDISAIGRRYVFGVGHVNSKSDGECDLVVWVKHDGMLWTLLVEVKNPEGYKWADHQIAFAAKFSDIKNARYILAMKASDVSQVIEEITGYSQKQLDSWDKHMGMGADDN